MINQPSIKQQRLLVCLGLALAVLAAYAPLWQCGFVHYDDGDYVVSNEMVKRGLTWPGLVWAFSTFDASNWHPLTWLSHMADSQIYGMNPVGHHLSSLLLHLANSILLFLLLQRITKTLRPAALVAGLFALHPVHVESVAWVAERKDVLSTFFWLWSVWCYVRFVEERKAGGPRPGVWYLGSVAFFALGLMAKPMVVTLPFILILFDYWPLRRGRPFVGLLGEKTPYFMLTFASCLVTYTAQWLGGAVSSLQKLPWEARLENIPIAYCRYLEKMFWPARLAVLYPIRRDWPVWEVACAGAFLMAVTGCVVWRARAQPYLAVGWFWFLGMLVPVIGLIQVGALSMADRYDYLPSVGLFIMVIWAAHDWVSRRGAKVWLMAGVLAMAGCMALTPLQVRYWRDSGTLFRHALDVTEDNGVIESNYGKLLFDEGRVDEALPHLLRAVRFSPALALGHYNLGQALLAKDRVAEALAQFQTQVELTPDDPIAQYNFGDVLLQHGLAADALPHLQKAVRIRPDAPNYLYELGNALMRTGRAAEAIGRYEKTLQIRPDFLQVCNNLAWIFATDPDSSLRNGPRAVDLALRADQLSGGTNMIVLGTLATVYAEVGQFTQAADMARRALRLAGPESQSPQAEALRAQLSLYQAGSPFRDAGLARPVSSPPGS